MWRSTPRLLGRWFSRTGKVVWHSRSQKERTMNRVFVLRRLALGALVIAVFGWLAAAPAGEIDPKAVAFQTLDQIKWVESRNGGSASAIITGDPSKEGLYVELM